MATHNHDIVIVGGGIVGLATAFNLAERQPGLRIGLIEKEVVVGSHQTGHNSGVLHRGIYYRPGSLKARLCVEGVERMIRYCESRAIPYELCGKVVVATNERELAALDELYRRGIANGVPGLRRLDGRELREIEPYARGIAALHSPCTGIVDYGKVAAALERDIRARGTKVMTGSKVVGIDVRRNGLLVTTTTGELVTRCLTNCAGLYSDTVARLAGIIPQVRVVPFRGEYYFVRPERQYLVRGLIYPVPDPDLPFLGVHFTRTVSGRVEAGPNAVFAFAREGYDWKTIHLRELAQTVGYPGSWRMARRWWRTGLDEFRRSFSPSIFAASLQQLVPEIRRDDLVPGGAGVRAQAVRTDGSLADDFVIEQSPHAIHVLNAPSPAATASLAIGDYIGRLAAESFASCE